jgi:Gluconolactonase
MYFSANRRKAFNFQEHNITGIPDGMTVDNKGNLWIACPFGGQVGISCYELFIAFKHMRSNHLIY